MNFIASTTSRADSSDCALSSMACERRYSRSSPVVPVRADSPESERSNSIVVAMASLSAAPAPATSAVQPAIEAVARLMACSIEEAKPRPARAWRFQSRSPCRASLAMSWLYVFICSSVSFSFLAKSSALSLSLT